ncbi:sce7725 family protein [Pandoraea sputorum]|uniref:sce7725 family protein n=1 Tax=Pandoraea sputorum TaxID=93222 RepID=UPI001E4B2777|nr:sce7725 family protein [Pandoraea sputorum]MCE4058724.1 sce7725 family protein [Pandoraea sputorum]
MYHPYLFARRGELLAFRDTADVLAADGAIIPVFEPVSSNMDSLRIALKVAEKQKQPMYLVLNPALGDFKGDEQARADGWRAEAEVLTAKNPFVRPTYLANPSATSAQLKRFVTKWAGRDAGIVMRDSAITAVEIQAKVAGQLASHRVFLKGGAQSAATVATFSGKNCVNVESLFKAQQSNAKYKGRELFTTAHLKYKAQGLGGFSDFTCLDSKFRTGGSTPAAVAIHLSYFQKNSKEVFVEHFVSVSQDPADRDVDKKMLEAISAAVAASKRAGDSFGLTGAYGQYVGAHHGKAPPSLQNNKRWSVAHHLDLMSGMLAGRYK